MIPDDMNDLVRKLVCQAVAHRICKHCVIEVVSEQYNLARQAWLTERQRVIFGNLDSALEGGQFEKGGYLERATPAEIADDMKAYAEDCEQFENNELETSIKDWLSRHKR